MSDIYHEKYREEYSMEVAVLCDVTKQSISAEFYDVRLERSIPASSACCEITEDNAAAELSRLIFMSIRAHGIPAPAVRSIYCSAADELSAALEELDPAEMFLPPDTEITVLPFVSMMADSRFAAVLAAVPAEEGNLVIDFGSTLNAAYYDKDGLKIASVALSGAFDATAIESGMACMQGAIDEVKREDNGTLCYCVAGDSDACGIAPSAVLDAVCIMRDEGIIDEDGTLTDRDLFYLGEDYFLSQSDIRAVQSDKAKSAAAIQCFLKNCGTLKKVYLGGAVLERNGVNRLAELGVITPDILSKAQVFGSLTAKGLQRCSVSGTGQLRDTIRNAIDITSDIYRDFDDMYITNLSF